MYVDSHAHLDGKQFDSDREQVIQRAHDGGVEALLAIGNGSDAAALACALPFAEKYPWIYASTGIHPHEAKEASEDLYAEMTRIARHPKVIAWGEIGLDYHYNHSPRETQREVFVRQMQLAKEAKLPIIIHCRPSEKEDSAWDEAFDLIEENFSPTGLRGIIHCFTGKPEHARRAVELDFLVSFSGAITFPKAENIRQAAVETPLDHILIETDCPYLAPIPFRGKRNEPAYVAKTCEKLADVRGTSPEEAAQATTANFYRLFGLRPVSN